MKIGIIIYYDAKIIKENTILKYESNEVGTRLSVQRRISKLCNATGHSRSRPEG